MLKAPILYKLHFLDKIRPKNDSRALIQGTAIHTFILEPELLDSEFVVRPSFSGTGSQARKQDWELMNSDKKIITMDEYIMVKGMRDSVMNHPVASVLLKGGQAEQTFTWYDKNTGVKCKIRPDYLNSFCVDVKSTEDASETAFNYTVRKYGYDIQGAFYLDGLNANGLGIERFYFIAIEKKPPYLVNVFCLSENDYQKGREKYIQGLEIVKESRENGVWEGYGDTVKLTRGNYE